MRLQILGHAGLRINAAGKELLCDPWTLGSCYWRSWWNYPPVPASLTEALAPDFIYLTHLHWDHFHGPTLRRFAKSTHFLIPYFRYDRMRRDLHSLGFNNVTEIKHAQRIELSPELAIRSYHFGPVFTDSAIVIEAEGVTIFNANDAKFAGLPLQQILSRYPAVDFCLRSHSSANARRCMHIAGQQIEAIDDDTHYVSSFSLFMKRVQPRFAIPFASNNCFLHRDVFEMNEFAQTPLSVKQYFGGFAEREGLAAKLIIMIPGDSWTSKDGFQLVDTDFFERRRFKLQEYAEQVRPTLDEYYKKEDKVVVSLSILERFFRDLWSRTPLLLRRRIKRESILLVATTHEKRQCFELSLAKGEVRAVPPHLESSFAVRAVFPAIILSQSVRMNMFSQGWISKRVHYYTSAEKAFVLRFFLRILELNEAELLPLRKIFTLRAFRALVPRWREALLYFQVVALLAKRRNFMEIESQLLKSKAQS
jgi:UDP-MurNAc hydroxylase